MKSIFDENIIVSKIVNVFLVEPKGGNQIHRNRRCHCIAFNQVGEKLYRFEGNSPYVISENEFMFFPKGSNYDVHELTDGYTYAINFETNIGDQFINEHRTVKKSKTILNLFKEIELIWRTKHTGYYQKSMSLMYEILHQMIKEVYSEYVPESKKQIISPAMEYIENNYHKEIISISHLAKLCNVSEVYFRTIFKSIYNTSPIKYINELKLSRAKELLMVEEISINDVTFMSGYNDSSTFSREFKKFTGITPAAYRKYVFKKQ